MKRSVAMVVLLLAAVAARGQQRPSATVIPGGGVTLTLPATVLQDVQVKKRLAGGLTTTFVVLMNRLDVGASPLSGAARLEVRYELWDEVYIVRRIDLDRRVEEQRLGGADALERWWRTPLRIFGPGTNSGRFNVELRVIPFSAAEEKDARQWLSKSAGVGGTANPSPQIVDVLIGTTISARPVTTFRWTVQAK